MLFVDKGHIKASIPKAILPQATLCYPIRQSQLQQVILDVSLKRGERGEGEGRQQERIKCDLKKIRDPAKVFVSPSSALRNSKEKNNNSMPRVLYVDSSSTARYLPPPLSFLPPPSSSPPSPPFHI